MTRNASIKLLTELQRLRDEVHGLQQALTEVVSGASSASVSGGSGSKSYTNWQPAQIREQIAEDLRQIAILKNELAGRGRKCMGYAQVTRV